jgi:hypothetical protein
VDDETGGSDVVSALGYGSGWGMAFIEVSGK